MRTLPLQSGGKLSDLDEDSFSDYWRIKELGNLRKVRNRRTWVEAGSSEN